MDKNQLKTDPEGQEEEVRDEERYETLQNLEDWLEGPVKVLGLLWLVLLIVEFVWTLGPFLNALVYVIWGIFVLDFGLRLFLAPRKREFIQRIWLTVLSLILPAFRVLAIFRSVRLLRLTRALRSLRDLRLVQIQIRSL